MPKIVAPIAENLDRVRKQIADACARADRDPADVQLVAVTKYARPEWIAGLVDLGVVDLGESRPQQLIARAAEFPTDIRWHLIGHLQRNKVAPVLPQVVLVHSVDSWRLLERIELVAGRAGLRPSVLLEVNISGESSKSGFTVEGLQSGWDDIHRVQYVEVAGLMTMAPLTDDPESARPVFHDLRAQRDRLAERGPWPLSQLSMGMSGDFPVAVEEGATLVRIGSALFDGLA